MASLFGAFNDALGENNSTVKLVIYSLPVFFCSYLYVSKNQFAAYLFAIPTLILLTALMCVGINNVRSNKREILTFNIITLISVTIKLFFAIVPLLLVVLFVGGLIVSVVKIPFEIPYIQLLFNSIVCMILFSVVLTAYISFSTSLNITDAYNLKVIFESSADVLINLLFLFIQLGIFNGIIVGFVWYLCSVVNIPITNPLFIYFCSFIFMLNISALSSYFAQVSYELIKGKDDDYRDNYYMSGGGLYGSNRKR